MRRALLAALLLALAAGPACGAREAKLKEGSVDACALLQAEDVRRALKAAEVTAAKGVLTQTWGSACRWSGGADAFLSVVVHTKHATQTFAGMKRRLPDVRNRPDLAPQAFQSGRRVYLIKRGALVTIEWSGAEETVVAQLVRALLEELDALAATQAVHR